MIDIIIILVLSCLGGYLGSRVADYIYSKPKVKKKTKTTVRPVRTIPTVHDDGTYTYKTELDDGRTVYPDISNEDVSKVIEMAEDVVRKHK